ncbi:ecdysteroid-regulated 16 kDa protein [Zeugodacus cucurbitae]|uniref:Ecdysteroid-regulated 16 kDa protein n=1 Tax=Zeugodacus cucurbitae TaxID=28588 RepID=A0A0A1WUA7_ZEUCU|nr:ecdysteroid-regulated 16 kDa protein [Zeugodacus cucurbitae]XP_011189116.1 ecdysteroid-regulated 16 kDa protein [Zeugodacus cucurbitae]XP_054081459.1 ecdysteroid-regulated 16 kDa protein [Zeugodacus cucurbitae]XP_054081460.1 ecdysteroid-regulated 16 kDa protein [Zeugodacus cucurbitae]
MKSYISTVTIFMVLFALTNATEVRKCPKSSARALTAEEVTISNCPKNKCTLKRNTEASIEMKIKPERDFNELNSDIQGIILDVPLPFPGYYGTSACPYIYDAEGKEKVGCPLKAGETYTYKNSFKILPIYPTVNLVIHWGLGDKQGDAVCFQIPAKIKS